MISGDKRIEVNEKEGTNRLASSDEDTLSLPCSSRSSDGCGDVGDRRYVSHGSDVCSIAGRGAHIGEKPRGHMGPIRVWDLKYQKSPWALA